MPNNYCYINENNMKNVQEFSCLGYGFFETLYRTPYEHHYIKLHFDAFP